MRIAVTLAATLCTAMLLFTALVLLWLSQVSNTVYRDGANALVIRAVLRADTSNVAAENLAGRVRQMAPGITVDLINEAMGRSLLALQEPWIAQMPDFEVTPLPMLLEMRHPDLLTKPLEVSKFVEKLGAEPEVDFMAYNETAHDKLTKLAGAASAIGQHALTWVLAAVAFAGFASGFAFFSITGRSLAAALTTVIISWAAGLIIALGSFRWWESFAITTGEWQRLTAGTYGWVAFASMFIMVAAAIVSLLMRRLQQ